MNNDDVSARDRLIAWSLLPFLTPNRTRLLLEHFHPGCPTRVLEGLLKIDSAQADLVKNPLRNTAAVAALRDAVITLADDDYPPALRQIIDPPLVLHVRGDRAILQKPSVAMVGSRHASPYALNAARRLGDDLSRAGLTIVSGLARGVDAASHVAALDAKGHTIAVLGTGIEIVYPRSNRALFRRIEQEGVIVSEFPPGTPPLPINFPIRNRVISGLSLGTVILEATSRSGSLITARTAAEQGREVFAVPGSIFSAGSEGTHRLIQYGAKLVHDVGDVLDEIRGFKRPAREHMEPPDEPLRTVLAVFTRDEGTHVDDAASKLGSDPASIAEPLLQLELGGWLQALPGGRWVRVR